MNLTAGWVDPYCNSNETLVFVNEKIFLEQKKYFLTN